MYHMKGYRESWISQFLFIFDMTPYTAQNHTLHEYIFQSHIFTSCSFLFIQSPTTVSNGMLPAYSCDSTAPMSGPLACVPISTCI